MLVISRTHCRTFSTFSTVLHDLSRLDLGLSIVEPVSSNLRSHFVKRNIWNSIYVTELPFGTPSITDILNSSNGMLVRIIFVNEWRHFPTLPSVLFIRNAIKRKIPISDEPLTVSAIRGFAKENLTPWPLRISRKDTRTRIQVSARLNIVILFIFGGPISGIPGIIRRLAFHLQGGVKQMKQAFKKDLEPLMLALKLSKLFKSKEQLTK